MNVTDSGPTNEQGLDGLQVGVFRLVHRGDIVHLQVQVLVHRTQGALYLDVIFQFQDDLLVHKGLEETEEEHGPK